MILITIFFCIERPGENILKKMTLML